VVEPTIARSFYLFAKVSGQVGKRHVGLQDVAVQQRHRLVGADDAQVQLAVGAAAPIAGKKNKARFSLFLWGEVSCFSCAKEQKHWRPNEP